MRICLSNRSRTDRFRSFSSADMMKIMFVCLGNICRSPMAECIMTHIVRERGLENKFIIASSATSDEEEGNSIYPPARRKLAEKGVEILPHSATVLERADKDKYDLIIAMEERNVRAINRIIGNSDKVHRLLDFSSCPRDIADPWWTGDFEKTYRDIVEGCESLIDYIYKNYGLQL